jgi:hypothetical protein
MCYDPEIYFWRMQRKQYSLNDNGKLELNKVQIINYFIILLKTERLAWKAICDEKISLSRSNSPLEVYMKTEYVMQSMRLTTLADTSAAGTAFSIAFWKTTLNA